MRLETCFKKGLLKKITPDLENAKRSVTIARSNIEDAVKNLKIECYRVVIVSSYMSMFHTARAILYKDGIKERSHICIPTYLREQYPELEMYANILGSYRILRHHVVYGLDVTIDENEAKEAINSAKKFVKVVNKMLH